MKKIMMLFMVLALSVGILSCGGGAGSADTPKGENPGLPSVVKLTPSHFIAQTNSYIFLHAQVLDGNGSPVKGVAVTFTNLSDPFGKITSAVLRTLHLYKPVGILSTTDARTNGLGIATVKITSTSSGFATIQVEVNKGAGVVRDRKTVFFTTSIGTTTPPPPTVTLHVDDGDGTYDEPADFDLLKTPGDNQRTIKAVVLDGYGVPLAGRLVTFGSDLPSEVTFTPSTPVYTNSNGEAFVTITVSPSIITNLERVLNITAGADTDNNGTIDTANMITLFLEPVTVSNVAVTANPSVVPLNGISTITTTVTLSTGGSAPDGSTVSFTSMNGGQACGTITPFAQTTGGVASASFTAPAVPPAGGTCTITAAIGGVTGSTNVTVTPSLMVQPNALTMNGVIGGTATYTIYGGVAPYTVASNNNSFPANLSGNVFTVSVAPNTIPTNVTYTVRDSIGSTATATLTIAGGSALAVLPSAVTVDSNAPDTTVNFTIFGGVAPYSVFTNNLAFPPSTPTVDSSDPHFTVMVPTGSASGTVTLTVRDSNGTTDTASITITAVPPQAMKVIPTAQTIANPVATNSRDYTVLGGKAPYTAYSNNPALVTVSVAGSTVTALVASVPSTDTTVTITIYDDLGSSVAATLVLDVPPILPLVITPSTQTISNPVAGVSTATYGITGGTGGYVFVSSSNGLVSGAVAGAVLTATVDSVPASDTTVTLTVRDSVGTTATASVVLDVPPLLPLAVLPGTQTADGVAGDPAVVFTVFGGEPPYDVFSNNPAFPPSPAPPAHVVNSGDSFTVVVPPSTPSTDVTYTVRDSAGTTVAATLSIAGAGAAGEAKLVIVPGSVSVVSSGSSQDVTFAISGGTPNYVTTSTDPANAYNSADSTGIFNGTPITVRVPAGATAEDVTLNVFDAVGGTTSAKLTIIGPAAPPTPGALTVSPSSVSVAGVSGTGDQVTFLITGGSGTYTGVVSSNTAVVPNPTLSTNLFTIDPKPVSASTAVTLTAFDDAGASATATVTVTPATSSLAINPSTISVENGDTVPYHIIGGLPPFDVFTSNSGVINVGGGSHINIPSRSFNANAAGPGAATITVVDSDGNTVTSKVTVTAPSVATPDFIITCDASVTVPTGATRTFTCSLTSLNSFSAPVTLTCPDLPVGSSCTGFNPVSPVTPAPDLVTAVIVTVNNASTGSGSYPFHVMGISGLLSHLAPVTLSVP